LIIKKPSFDGFFIAINFTFLAFTLLITMNDRWIICIVGLFSLGWNDKLNKFPLCAIHNGFDIKTINNNYIGGSNGTKLI